MKLYFLTSNENKAEESIGYFTQKDIKSKFDIEICIVRHDVQEIMHPNLENVVNMKALEAYRYLKHPCVVEHGGLFFDGLPQLPGPLGKLIWNAVGDRMCDFLRKGETRAATARAILGYCDGRRINLYSGETPGEVAEGARGDYNRANWDPIFRPQGSTETYGEMGREKKLLTSPLVKAWDRFLLEQSPQSTRLV